MHPQVWVTSGHVGSFSDPLVECATCHRRYRLDELPGAEDLSVTDLSDPTVIERFQPDLPERRRPAVAAAPLQPDVPDAHGPGPGRRLGRLLPARDRAGLVRELQERPAELAEEDPVRDRPDRQELPERDQPRQLRLPDARVRADGDAVLRPAGRGGGDLRGVAAAAVELVHALRRDGVAPALPRARARRAGPLREEGDRRRVPLPVRLEGARGDPQPRRLRPVAAPGGVGREPRVLRPGDRRALHPVHRRDRRRARTGRRSRS